jgi:hypothetical protein
VSLFAAIKTNKFLLLQRLSKLKMVHWAFSLNFRKAPATRVTHFLANIALHGVRFMHLVSFGF